MDSIREVCGASSITSTPIFYWWSPGILACVTQVASIGVNGRRGIFDCGEAIVCAW